MIPDEVREQYKVEACVECHGEGTQDHQEGSEWVTLPCPECTDAPIMLDPQERAERVAERDHPERAARVG